MDMTKRYLLEEIISLDQMHDERVDEIFIKDGQLFLCFNELHFDHNGMYLKAKIIFSGFEDILCDSSIDIFSIERCKIREGRRLYIDEFISYVKKEKIELEVIDILYGYGKILITGEIINSDGTYGDKFNFSIFSKEILYSFS